MRKLLVGLVSVALLAVAAPAIAQQADGLGLIASGAVVPFVGNGKIFPGSVSFLEIAAPVVAAPSTHAFFFDAACNKGPTSLPLSLTQNDIRVQQITGISQNCDPTVPGCTTGIADGLLTIGAGASQFHLDPLTGVDNPNGPNFPAARPFETPAGSPIQARVLWVNPAQNLGRVLEPIGIAHYEIEALFSGPNGVLGPLTGAAPSVPLNASTANTPFTWNPLRSGHTFFAPVEGNGVSTFLYLVCPNANIVGPRPSTDNLTQPAFQTDDFPPLLPPPVDAGKTTPLDALVYDTEENPLLDVHPSCNCLTAFKLVTDVSPIFGDAGQAPNGTYTELVGGLALFPKTCENEGQPTPACERYSFTGYRAIRVATAPVFDLFGRLWNGNACVINFESNHEFTECGHGLGQPGIDFLR